jgi:hypothetical protein
VIIIDGNVPSDLNTTLKEVEKLLNINMQKRGSRNMKNL